MLFFNNPPINEHDTFGTFKNSCYGSTNDVYFNLFENKDLGNLHNYLCYIFVQIIF